MRLARSAGALCLTAAILALSCSPGARDLISRILVPDPNQRLPLQVAPIRLPRDRVVLLAQGGCLSIVVPANRPSRSD